MNEFIHFCLTVSGLSFKGYAPELMVNELRSLLIIQSKTSQEANAATLLLNPS